MSVYPPEYGWDAGGRVQRHVHYHTCSWKQIIAYAAIGAGLATYVLKGGCVSVLHELKEKTGAIFDIAGKKLEAKVKEFVDEVKK